MGAENEGPAVVEDFAGALKLYGDGSIVRTDQHLIVKVPAEEDGDVASRDVVIDEAMGIWVRIYLPNAVASSSPCKLPVVLFFHGGGFCFLSPAFLTSHRFCQKWAAGLGVVMVSVNYRLAPEHRLPAAFDDSMAVLQWLLCSPTDPWLKSSADLNNVFLIGESSGGNIVHHLLIRNHVNDNMRGAILLQPFFGGEERTESENACPGDVHVNVEACDRLWRLALPTGANRNHPFSNPVMYLHSQSQLPSELTIPPMLFVLGGKDCLSDRGVEYYKAMLKSGKCKHIHLRMFEGEGHGFHQDENSYNTTIIMREAALFVSSHCVYPLSK